MKKKKNCNFLLFLIDKILIRMWHGYNSKSLGDKNSLVLIYQIFIETQKIIVNILIYNDKEKKREKKVERCF